MACPICDQKPMNCDCTEAEKRMYSEAEDLEIEIERLHRLIGKAADDLSRLQDENLRLRGLCGLSPKQPMPEMMS